MATTELTSEALLLPDVNNAIRAILVGGQSYSINGRQMTRADLGMLYKIRDDLEARISENKSSPLIDRTYVAVFDGR